MLPTAACELPSSGDGNGDVSYQEDVDSVSEEVVGFRNDQAAIIYPGESQWGGWMPRVYCDPGMWAVGYRMRVEGYQGGGLSGSNDDTSLNSVQLLCKSPTTGATQWISSYDGLWGGDFRSAASCSGTNNFLRGARIRLEGSQGGDDDTAANDMQFSCTHLQNIYAPGGNAWGSWQSWKQCPANTAVCGLQIKFEGSQGGGDDTAMNGIELECCNLPCTGSCGNGTCDTMCENPSTCSADCGYCGNGACNSTFENASSCIQDCGYCGDGTCYDETSASCPADCGGPGDCEMLAPSDFSTERVPICPIE